MDNFWENYIIWKSRGYGHCFVYAIVNSHNSQHPENQPLDTQSVFDLLKSETMNNMSVYTPYIRNESPEILIQEMDEYIIHKRYKSLYGDNVPIIEARALCVNVAIVSNFGNKPERLRIKPTDDQNIRKCVYIYSRKASIMMALFQNQFHTTKMRRLILLACTGKLMEFAVIRIDVHLWKIHVL